VLEPSLTPGLFCWQVSDDQPGLDGIGPAYASTVLRSDPQASIAVREDLEAYLVPQVDDGHGLRCPRYATGPWGIGCGTQFPSDRVFSPGQLSYVGDHFVLSDAEGPLWILVIGMHPARTAPTRRWAFEQLRFSGLRCKPSVTRLAGYEVLQVECRTAPSSCALALALVLIHLTDQMQQSSNSRAHAFCDQLLGA
jgi:hypothetical protein